jgi:hypothetical protein
MENLALIFSTIDTSKNFFKKRIRRNSYNTSIASILRWLPNKTEAWLIDNSGYLDKKGADKFFEKLELNLNQIAMKVNLGKANKGLGELSMLEYASEFIDFYNYKQILFFTGRHFVTNPYLLEKIVNNDIDITVSKPKFFQLSGKSETDGNLSSYNDMFFAMKPKQIIAYIDYFKLNRSRLVNSEIGSEELLFEFIQSRNSKYPLETLFLAPALGIVRFQRNIFGKLDRLEIL